MDQESTPLPSMDEIKRRAAEIGAAMKSSQAITPELRVRFIEVRSALFMRGVYDPVLVRFDSATAPRASNAEIGEQLETLAQSL
jgi:hypothetical protein